MNKKTINLTIFAAFSLLLYMCGACISKDVPDTGTVTHHTLENGLRVVIVQNKLAPVVSTVMNYLVGSNQSPVNFPGMAHAEEHMMFRGSPGLTADQLANILAAMGGMFNADTQQTLTQYFLIFPASDIDLALRIEATRMGGILDDPGLWAKERGALEQEVSQDLSDPEYNLYATVLAYMLSGTPYEHTGLGTVSSFKKTTAPMLKKFYQTWYKPNNAILVIAGDIDPEKVIVKVRQYFGSIPSGTLPARKKITLNPVKAETFRLKTDTYYGLAVISFMMPGYRDRDWAASQILSDILTSQRSDLYELVTEGKAFYTTFDLSTFPDVGLGHAMAMFPKGTGPQGLIMSMRKVLINTASQGFSADMVEAAKRIRLTKAELKRTSIPGLADAWSRALALEGRNSPDDTLNDIRKVAVDDVNRIAKKYLVLDRAVTTVLEPESSGSPVSVAHRAALESPSMGKIKEVKPPAWAKEALSRLNVPALTIDPVVSRLSNGLLLIVQPSSVSKTVSVYGRIRNEPGIETPQGKEGVDEVLDQLLLYGTQSYDRIGFQTALDNIGAQLSAGVDFSLEVLNDSFEAGIRLLAEVELRPSLPEKPFSVVREQVRSAVAGRLSSADYLTERTLEKALYPPGDPCLREPTPATVSSLTLQDVKNYHRNVFRPELTTMVVIGNITPDNARAVVEKYFGSWNSEGKTPETRLPPVPPNAASSADIPDKTRVQAKVVLSQTLGMGRSHPDYYALELGNSILGGSFYATRLYRELREELGLVYHVSSTLDMGETRSRYVIEFGCDPKDVPRVRSIILRNISELQKTPVSKAELQQAKAILLRKISLSESSVKQIATDIIDRITKGLPIDEPARAAHTYMDLTADDVRKAYAHWIRPADLVQVTEQPVK
jgi:zinc protease